MFEIIKSFAIFVSLSICVTVLLLMIVFSERIKYNNRLITQHLSDTNIHYHLIPKIEEASKNG